MDVAQGQRFILVASGQGVEVRYEPRGFLQRPRVLGLAGLMFFVLVQEQTRPSVPQALDA
jgi:hypothetical protein